MKLRTSYQPKGANGQPGGKHDGIFEEDFDYVAGSGDLHECSGRTGVTPEFPNSTYYHALTEDFRFVLRAFRGQPDPSLAKREGTGGQGGPASGRRNPPPERPGA